MILRRKAREFAVQMLFQWEMSGGEPWRVESHFWKNARAAKDTRVFANQLFEGASAAAKQCDAHISEHAKNWRIERIAVMDRTILRLAVYELKHMDTPPKVVINEAITLAKKFSDEDSPKFINGVLDAIHKSLATRH